MSAAWNPATAAFALVTGALSGIGAKTSALAARLRHRKTQTQEKSAMLKTLLIGALMLAPGSAAPAREPSVHPLPSHGIVSAVDTPRLPWQAPGGHRQP